MRRWPRASGRRTCGGCGFTWIFARSTGTPHGRKRAWLRFWRNWLPKSSPKRPGGRHGAEPDAGGGEKAAGLVAQAPGVTGSEGRAACVYSVGRPKIVSLSEGDASTADEMAVPRVGDGSAAVVLTIRD